MTNPDLIKIESEAATRRMLAAVEAIEWHLSYIKRDLAKGMAPTAETNAMAGTVARLAEDAGRLSVLGDLSKG